MAVITKEQIEFLLEEGVKVRMKNEELERENLSLRQRIEMNETYITTAARAEYDRGYDDGHKAARRLVKG